MLKRRKKPLERQMMKERPIASQKGNISQERQGTEIPKDKRIVQKDANLRL